MTVISGITKRGSLDRRIIIQRKTSEFKDVAGELLDDWANWFSVWAKVDHSSGFERESSGAETAFLRTKFTVPYSPNFYYDERMRISYDNDLYDIEEVQETIRRRELVIYAVRWQ